jgi:Fic family protein
LHWDKLRHLEPPAGLSAEEWWLGLKLSRPLRPLPLTDSHGAAAGFGAPDIVQRLLHYVDQQASGQIAMPEVVTADDQARQHWLVNSLMEEAIRSSQLEGASTSRAIAKEMLRTGREPTDRSERMIVNNYEAERFMREIGDQLTPSHVLELQHIVTRGTLDDSAAGRLQTPDEERVAVIDPTSGDVLHAPPPAEQLPRRLDLMCAFANASDDEGDVFVHPVIRSILLHFWLAYDHPFEDGNGRTARLLFYWSMRKHGYWLTEYLSISRILREAPSKYSRSFLYTETDALDTTYFLVYQLQVIERAISELHVYLRRKVKQARAVRAALRDADLNHRQVAMLNHAVQHPGQEYTYRSHAASHDVTHETARTDLLRLHALGLLTRRRSGRRHVFGAVGDLGERLTPPEAAGPRAP